MTPELIIQVALLLIQNGADIAGYVENTITVLKRTREWTPEEWSAFEARLAEARKSQAGASADDAWKPDAA